MRDRFSAIEGNADLREHLTAVHRFMPGLTLTRDGDVRQCQGMAIADWVARESNLNFRGELAVPGRETDNLSAPRFIQENQHRDVTLSALVGFQPTRRGRVRPEVLGGLGVAASRTTRASRLLIFTPTGPVPYDTPNIIKANE